MDRDDLPKVGLLALIALGCFTMMWFGKGDGTQLTIILAGIATWAAQSQNSRATTRDVLKVQAAGPTVTATSGPPASVTSTPGGEA